MFLFITWQHMKTLLLILLAILLIVGIIKIDIFLFKVIFFSSAILIVLVLNYL